MNKCKVVGCRNRASARGLYGYCGGCYAIRWAFAGLPDPERPKVESPSIRLARKRLARGSGR